MSPAEKPANAKSPGFCTPTSRSAGAPSTAVVKYRLSRSWVKQTKASRFEPVDQTEWLQSMPGIEPTVTRRGRSTSETRICSSASPSAMLSTCAATRRPSGETRTWLYAERASIHGVTSPSRVTHMILLSTPCTPPDR